MIDPVARAINEFYPIPNRTPSDPFTSANNFERLGSEIRSMRQYTIKGDHRFSNANSLFVRYSFFNHKTDNGASGSTICPNDVIAKRDDDLKNWNAVVSDTHIISSSVLNELRIGADARLLPVCGAQLRWRLAGQVGADGNRPPGHPPRHQATGCPGSTLVRPAFADRSTGSFWTR